MVFDEDDNRIKYAMPTELTTQYFAGMGQRRLIPSATLGSKAERNG